MSPRPRTARAVADDGHRVALDRVLERLLGVVGDRLADARDARRVGHREVVAGAQRVAVALLDLAAQVQQERAVGDVDDARAVDARRSRRAGRPRRPAPSVSTVMSRTRWRASASTRSIGADRPARAADGAGDLREHARAVGDLHAQDEAVLGGRPGQRTRERIAGRAARIRPPGDGG